MLMLPLLEGRGRWLVAFLILGCYIALCAAEANSFIRGALRISSLELSLTFAPLVEELLKAIPVLAFAWLRSDRRSHVLPVAFSLGIGFAVMENTCLLTGSGWFTVGWALVRGFSTGLMHGLTTLMVGVGLTFVRTRRKLFYTGTFALLAVAVTYHAMFNLLVSASGAWEWAGFALPPLTYAIAWLVTGRGRARLARTGAKDLAAHG